MKKLILLFLLIPFITIAQGPSSCACVWSDTDGNLNCVFGNCGGGNWSNCYNQVSTPNLWQSGTCPNPPTTSCNPYMWNTGLNGSCWYQGAGCSGQAVCEYINNPLPVELIDFKGESFNGYNTISWSTISESNSSHFILQHFIDTNNNTTLVALPSAGNSTQKINYNTRHQNPESVINYYFLVQVDIDGVEKYYGPISIDNSGKRGKLLKTINMVGQEVGDDYNGVVIEIYDDGTTKKIYQ
jgi:hypothetical protein